MFLTTEAEENQNGVVSGKSDCSVAELADELLEKVAKIIAPVVLDNINVEERNDVEATA